jgi:hypothetical protein
LTFYLDSFLSAESFWSFSCKSFSLSSLSFLSTWIVMDLPEQLDLLDPFREPRPEDKPELGNWMMESERCNKPGTGAEPA